MVINEIARYTSSQSTQSHKLGEKSFVGASPALAIYIGVYFFAGVRLSFYE